MLSAVKPLESISFLYVFVLKRAMITLSKNARSILEKRYLKQDDAGNVCETPDDLFKRVAENISYADAKYLYPKKVEKLQKKFNKEFYDLVQTEEFKKLVNKDKNVEKTRKEFYALISSLEFLPNSPTLLNAGRKLQQLSASFVLPIKDNIDSIFKGLHDAALIHRTGAGTGFNFSKLRPKGERIGSAGYTSGSVSFMKIYDAATEQVKLGGVLRGANMGILDVSHPDCEELITLKNRENCLTNFNISIALSNAFMTQYREDSLYEIVNPHTKKREKKKRAREIMKIMAEHAWKNGDPGVVFLDKVNEHNPTPALGRIESTDSCGEQPLLPYESCNLGSINLAKMVSGKKLDEKKLKKTVRKAIHFLDNVIDLCHYPLSRNWKIVRQNRKIGLGVMGFADLLILLKIPYNSKKGVLMGERIMNIIRKEADKASSALAATRGTFPAWNESIYNKKSPHFKGEHNKLRNATRTTIAPTGTISIIGGCSSGIEPLFALSHARRTAEGKTLYYFNEELKKALQKEKLFTQKIKEEIATTGSIQHITKIPKRIREVFVIATDISPEYHVRMQAAFQKYVDNGISKTVLLPSTATPQDVEHTFVKAYELGCKGISVYRSGSREGEVIYLSSKRDEQINLGHWMGG